MYGQVRRIGRNAAKSPPCSGDMAEFRTSLILGRLRRIFGESRKSRMSVDAAAGRFCGDGARFMANSGRSAGVPRNPHLLGEIMGDFGPRLSLADCVGSPGRPENLGRSRICHPAVSLAKGLDLWPVRGARPKFREISTYWGRTGVRPSWTHGQCRMIFRGPWKSRMFADLPAGRFYGVEARLSPNFAKPPPPWGGLVISDLADPWPTA